MDIIVENLFPDRDCRKLPVPAFFVRSTAPSNVEDPPCESQANQPTIADVIDILYYNSQSENQENGLVIAIHGYNTGADVVPDGVRQYWYQPLSDYVNQDSYLQKKSSSLVFLGYRWPSESLKKKGIRNEARQAMPVMLSFLLYNGIFVTVVALLLALLTAWKWIAIAAILGTIGFSIVLAVYLLRISVYFRDSYRATMFGVPDLVELIRQLDQGLIERTTRDNLTDEAVCDRIAGRVPALQALDRGKLLEALQSVRRALTRYPDLVIDLQNDQFQNYLKRVRHDISSDISDETLLRLTERFVLIQTLEYDAADRYWQKNPIKLSFLGHSMGGHVTTQVIRILSDVFDSRSIGKVGDMNSQKTPSSRLGRVFKLGRLVLVAPDIPVLTITSGRTNFLKSALRRFEEAYLFSNEGDLALRLASTAANYFSFPARTRTQGYRLGNVTVSHPEQTKSKSRGATPVYGIVNLWDIAQFQGNLLRFLEINVLSKDRNQRLDPSSQQAEKQATGEAVASVQEDREAIADLFTYFDCTEYRDKPDYGNDQAKESYFLILDNQKTPLRLFDYIRLFVAFAKGKRDVHGGYFQAPFIKILMYRLAFVGFQGLLDSLILTEPKSLGISAPLPEPLNTDLAHVRETAASKKEKRWVALNYLSWLCAQKQLQVALSPERHKVDVEGLGRQDAREKMLLQKVK